MKKRILHLSDWSNDCNTVVFGISSVSYSYQIVHFINKFLEVPLLRTDDYVETKDVCNSNTGSNLFDVLEQNFDNSPMEIHCPLYYSLDDYGDISMMFVQNIVNNDVLVKDIKGCDFILFVRNCDADRADEIKNALSSLKCIQCVFEIDALKYKKYSTLNELLELFINEVIKESWQKSTIQCGKEILQEFSTHGKNANKQ